MKRLVLTLFVLIFGLSAWSQVPKLINFQGRLNGSDGSALTGQHDIIFTLYDAANGGNVLWTEAHQGVALDNGLFSVVLGSITPFPDGLFDGSKELWLGIKVDNGDEFPRKRFYQYLFQFIQVRLMWH